MLSYVTGCPSFRGLYTVPLYRSHFAHASTCWQGSLPSAVVTSAVVNTVLTSAGASAFSESQPVLP